METRRSKAIHSWVSSKFLPKIKARKQNVFCSQLQLYNSYWNMVSLKKN